MKNIHVLPTDKPSRLVGSRLNLSLKDIPIPSFETFKTYNIYITSDEEIKEGDWCILLENHYVNGGIGKYNTKKAIGYGLHNTKFFKKIILTTDKDLIKDGVQAIPDEFLEWFVKNPSCEEVEVRVVKSEECDCYYTKFCHSTMLDKSKHCRDGGDIKHLYNIIIPKEEPKKIFDLPIATNLGNALTETMKSVSQHEGGVKQGEIIKQEFLKQKRMSGAKTVSRILEESKQETLEEAAMKMYPIKTDPSGYDINMFSRYGFYNGAKWQVEKTTITTDDAYSEGFENGKNWQKERLYTEEEVKEILFHRETHYMKTAHHLHINEWFEQFKKK